MSMYYIFICEKCGNIAQRYRNSKFCQKCGGRLARAAAASELPITESWLAANGWHLVGERNDERTRPENRLRRREIKGDGGRKPFESADDLCIDVAPGFGQPPRWHVWLHQCEPYRFIHLRTVGRCGELIQLYEALTGVKWEATEPTVEQVLEKRKSAVSGGCCNRFADQMSCTCLEDAQRREKP